MYVLWCEYSIVFFSVMTTAELTKPNEFWNTCCERMLFVWLLELTQEIRICLHSFICVFFLHAIPRIDSFDWSNDICAFYLAFLQYHLHTIVNLCPCLNHPTVIKMDGLHNEFIVQFVNLWSACILGLQKVIWNLNYSASNLYKSCVVTLFSSWRPYSFFRLLFLI